MSRNDLLALGRAIVTACEERPATSESRTPPKPRASAKRSAAAAAAAARK